MIDFTYLLPPNFMDETEENIVPFDTNDVPNLENNIYYCICSTGEGLPFETDSMFSVKNFCQSLYYAFIQALNDLKEEWSIYDHYTAKTSPAFSFSMFYDNAGILVDLVPCFRFSNSGNAILHKVNLGMSQYFSELASCPVDEFYNIQPLYLVCVDNESPDNPSSECTFMLSASLYEKFFYKNINSNVSIALRVFRYLCQNFPTKLGETNGVWQKKEKVIAQRKWWERKERIKHFFRINNSREFVISKYPESDPVVTFGCQTSISSYFYTNLILKLISNGKLLTKWKKIVLK